MFVIKRNRKNESVKFDKITARIEKLCYGLDRRFVNSIDVAKKVIEGLYDGVTTTELDNLAAATVKQANWCPCSRTMSGRSSARMPSSWIPPSSMTGTMDSIISASRPWRN